MNVALYVTHQCNVAALDELVYGVGHASHEQIYLELLQHVAVQRVVKRLSLAETLCYAVDGCLSAAHRQKKLLKVERVHLLYRYASNRHRRRLCQGHSKLRTARNVAISPFFIEKFKHCHEVWIALYLVEKNQCVGSVAQLVACQCSELQIKIVFASYCCKDAGTFFVGFEIYLDKVFEQPCANISYDE